MAERIGRAVLELTVDDKQYKLALDQVKKDSEKAATHVRGIGQAINLAVFREFASIATGALKTVGDAFGSLVERGAEVLNIDNAFTQLTGAIGETREAMLETTRSATKGLISDFDLMAAGNKAMLLGLPVTSESMGTMAQAATTLGRAMGQDAKKSFDDLITALGRGSPLILDNLGITVKVGEANEAYARSLGKSASELTEGEKKMAFYNAAMEAARKKVEEIGGIHLSLRDHVQVAMVTVQNFIDSLGVAVNRSPVLTAAMEVLGEAFRGAFGPGQKDLVGAVLQVIEDLAITAVDAGQVVVWVARQLSNAWDGLKFIFNSVGFVFSELVATWVGGIAVLLEAAARIPRVGEQFQGAAAFAKALAIDVKNLGAGFLANADAALDSAARSNAALNSVDQVLENVKAAMLAARAAAGDMAAGTGAAMQALGAATEGAAARTEEQSKKIGDVYRQLTEEIFVATKVGLDKRLAELAFAEQREIEGIRALKGITQAEMDARILLVQEKYRLLADAARLSGDEIRNREQQLQQEIALAQATGIEQRLLQLEFARQKELEGLAFLRAQYGAEYERLAALVNEKYQQMLAAARGHFTSVEQAAAAAGFKTRAELQTTADNALRLFQQMEASGKFTAEQLKEAWERYERARREAAGQTQKHQLTAAQAVVQGTLEIFGVLGQKYKAAAIAGAIIATYQAIAKALASAPWPFNLALAAGAAAAGWANVDRIRSAKEGWAMGTPNLDFVDFRHVSLQPLHREEAVIPRGRGHLLAGEIAAEMPDDGSLEILERIADAMEALPQTVKRAFRDALVAAS